MSDQATLAIVIQDGGSSGGSAPAPRAPEPIRPTGLRDNPDLDAAFGFKPTAAPSLRPTSPPAPPPPPKPTQAPAPAGPTIIDWAHMQPPPVRDPNRLFPPAPIAPTRLPAPRGGAGAADLAPTAFKQLTGVAESLLPGLSKFGMALGPVGLAFTAVTAGAEIFKTAMDFSTRSIKAESTARQAMIRGDLAGQIVANLLKPSGWDYVPIVGGVRRSIKENEAAQVEAADAFDKAVNARARELARVSPRIGQAVANAEVSKLQGDIRVADVLGESYARNLELRARRDAAADALNARTNEAKTQQRNRELQMEAQLLEVATTLKDMKKIQEIQHAVEEAEKGNRLELLKLTREMRDLIKKAEEEAEKRSKGKPLGWLEDVLQQGVLNLPQGRGPDPIDRAGAAGIHPAFLP